MKSTLLKRIKILTAQKHGHNYLKLDILKSLLVLNSIYNMHSHKIPAS